MKTAMHPVINPVQALLFMIAPPRHIVSDVFVLKDDVHYLIGRPFEDRYTPPHISLFRYHDLHVDEMIQHVTEKAKHFKPFNIYIKDLSASHEHHSHRIYLNIVNKYPLRDLFGKLIRHDSGYTPHLGIAQGLDSTDFMKSWPYLKSLPYTQNFLCDRITVLAKVDNEWMHYQDIPFGDA
jgi:hypothetical protein